MLAIKTKEEMIASAVLWWVEQLAGSPKGLNDDRESFGSLLAILLSAMHGSEDTTAESQQRFAKELKRYLEKESEKQSIIILSVDYVPEYPLSDICQKAGVSGTRFPMKTTMWIDFEEEAVTWRTVRGPEGTVYPPEK